MVDSILERRNFLFFLNEVNPVNFGGSLISGLVNPSSWQVVTEMINAARQKDVLVRNIKKAQLYIHVPFCGRICTFCHCSKTLLRRRSEIDEFVDVLIRQMNFFAPVYRNMETNTLIFGGGTPSVLDEKQMTKILDGVDKAFPSRARQIQYEINPASWSASKLSVLSQRGLHRLSIGVQSFDEKVLKRVSRAQTKRKVLWCLRSARKERVPYVNVDLMAGLPGQTAKGLLEDLNIILNEGANVVHVEPYGGSSVAALCAPGETVLDFHKRRDLMMRSAVEVLVKQGFRRKGLQGTFTRNGEGEEHNQEAYLRLEASVLGLGPFARGQFPGVFFYNAGQSKSPKDFPEVEVSEQDAGIMMSQYAAHAMIDGLDEKVFLSRFGVPFERHCGEGLRYLKESGLIESSKGIWKFSGKPDVFRIWEYIALSRVLLGENVLSRFRAHLCRFYDPKKDYSKGVSMIKTYGNNSLMTLYYTMVV